MLGNLTPDILITRIIVLVIAFTVHEFSHAFVADRFGDDTPRRQGRLTLNPLVHLDPLGSLMLLVGGFGWGRPVEIRPVCLGAALAGCAYVGSACRAGLQSGACNAGFSAVAIRDGALCDFDLGLVPHSQS